MMSSPQDRIQNYVKQIDAEVSSLVPFLRHAFKA